MKGSRERSDVIPLEEWREALEVATQHHVPTARARALARADG